MIDIRDLVDSTKETTIFYSGVEYEMYFNGCYNMGVRNFLMSYEHCKHKGAGQLKTHNDISLMVDSGAYTYLNNPKYVDYSIDDWERHIISYLKWCEDRKDFIFAIVELDLQEFVGIETVTRWRKEYFEPFMLKTEIPVIFVYHHMELESWEDMCQRYPYVGFSGGHLKGLSDLTVEQHKQMIATAEKYGAVVHGFGMTKTRRLNALPYYSVDSTSWKYGFLYGKISIWDESACKLQQFKADRWDDVIYPVISKYKDIKFDEYKLKNYDELELLKANVYAFMKAEAYIRERLRSKMYWKRGRLIKTDLNKVDEDFFPPESYFQAATELQNQEYARKLNINPEAENLANILYDTTSFCNWENPNYENMVKWYSEHEEVVNAIHADYINKVTLKLEDRIEELKAFFIACVEGENDRLLHIGTNFDRHVKEREEYITDDELEIEDIPVKDLEEVLKGMLPTNTSVNDIPDDVFTKANIVPVRDTEGNLTKGVRTKRLPKKVYSGKMPKFACDTCNAAARCPEYKAGYVCAYNKQLSNRFDMRNTEDVLEAMQSTIEYNTERMSKAMIEERVLGAVSPEVTAMIRENVNYMQMLLKLKQESASLKHTRSITGDGTYEETTITNPQKGSILEDIIMKAMQPKRDDITALKEKIEQDY